jgi:exodeoxyribonuclease V alpha subunit
MQTLVGTLERIVYENQDDGYTVARFTCKDYPNELVTAVGNLMSSSPGESMELKGWWVTDSKYGRQFKIIEYRTILPATLVGIKKYLGSGLIKGIGPVMAARIVSHFELETLDIIEKEPQKLLQVRGIGLKRVSWIVKAWEEQKEIKEIMIFLQSHSVSTNFAVKIYKTYQNEAIKVVKEDPYRLADDIYGIGFRTADKIAQNMGMDKNSPSRIASGIKYVLSQAADEGHSYLPVDKLTSETSKILEVDENLVKSALESLKAKETIVVEEATIYLAPFYFAEVGIANRVAAILKSAKPQLDEAKIFEAIIRLERLKGLEFSQLQRQAIKKAVMGKFMILTGGPGTGKTTTVMGIIELFKQLKLAVALAAPTGRAAKRLSETTNLEAKTIHRLLEFSPAENSFKRNLNNPLNVDAIIVDEMSMVDLILMNNLLKAIPSKATLIFVGDADQLPSVGAGNVLKDLIDSQSADLVTLNEIFRQAQKSMIITNAHKINKGQLPQFSGPKERDFFFIEEEDPEKTAEFLKELCCKRLPSYYEYDPFDDLQLLCPMHRGLAGADNMNRLLQETLNPNGDSLPRGARDFRLGDKVMQIRNNYDLDVFNGDIGRIVKVDLVNQRIAVNFLERIVWYDMADLGDLVLAYAVTIHKAQGSEYQAVVIPILTQHYMMLQRNLLYTAITRAKELVVLVGSKKAIAMAVRNDKVTKRYTGLAKRIKAALAGELKTEASEQLALL